MGGNPKAFTWKMESSYQPVRERERAGSFAMLCCEEGDSALQIFCNSLGKLGSYFFALPKNRVNN